MLSQEFVDRWEARREAALIPQIQGVRCEIGTCDEWSCKARSTFQIMLFYTASEGDGELFYFCTNECCAKFIRHDTPVYGRDPGYHFCSACSRFILIKDVDGVGVNNFVDAPKDFQKVGMSKFGQICLLCYKKSSHKKRERASEEVAKKVVAKKEVAKKEVAKEVAKKAVKKRKVATKTAKKPPQERSKRPTDMPTYSDMSPNHFDKGVHSISAWKTQDLGNGTIRVTHGDDGMARFKGGVYTIVCYEFDGGKVLFSDLSE